MLICHEHKFIFLLVPKSASTPLHRMLLRDFSCDYVFDENQPNPGSHHIVLPEQYSDYFTFTCVRNPYSRFLSIFNYYSNINYKISRGTNNPHWEDLDDYLTYRQETRSQYDILFHTPVPPNGNPIRLDAIIRQESLDEDFHRLPFVKRHHRIYRLNQSKRRLHELPEHAVTWVRQNHYLDFIAFGYDPRHVVTLDPLDPTQIPVL